MRTDYVKILFAKRGSHWKYENEIRNMENEDAKENNWSEDNREKKLYDL